MSSEIKYEKSLIEVIKSRISVRGYNNKEVPEEIIDKLNEYIGTISSPFEAKIRFKICSTQNIEKEKDVKLGTYGVIRGTSTFIIAAVEKGKWDFEQVGFIFEHIILYATSLGIGTCYLGGTFKRGEFSKAIDLKENEILPIISPIGYSKKKADIINLIFRFTAKSNNRKSWEELFFQDSFKKPLNKEGVGKYEDVLESVRIAPSASNKQPWRIIKEGDAYHFYLAHTKGYANALGFDIQRVDIGIAMCHFKLVAEELKLNGRFKVLIPNVKEVPENNEYIISWI